MTKTLTTIPAQNQVKIGDAVFLNGKSGKIVGLTNKWVVVIWADCTISQLERGGLNVTK